ncbi:hypothetical protein PM082_004252 [Marasmius tenuissimus]|nr:hypothetical protein PM082_004252 [Marasmius tenuissimus]
MVETLGYTLLSPIFDPGDGEDNGWSWPIRYESTSLESLTAGGRQNSDCNRRHIHPPTSSFLTIIQIFMQDDCKRNSGLKYTRQ